MRLLLLLLSVLWFPGCSVLMALDGNDPLDYSLFKPGTPRHHVLARYGTPVSSETKGGNTLDTYEFEEGDEAAPERIGIHMMADIMTFGAWELVGTPYEWFQGEDVAYVLEYGPEDTLQSVVPPLPGLPLSSLRNPIHSGSRPFSTLSPKPSTSFPSSDVDQVPLVRNHRVKPQNHAIIIGIEHYREELPKATYARHDAKVMAQYLTQALGYPEENVVVLLDDRATRADLHKYVESWLPNRVEPSDSVFIYFSGHGAPNVKTGEAYVVPYDGDPLYIDKTGYSLQLLYDHLNRLPSKEVVVVLDSCFSGAGGRSVIAKGMRPLILSVENPLLAQGTTFVLGASSGDQVSNTYEKKEHGLLTYFFLKGLQGQGDLNKDGAIDLMEVYTYLKPQVERTARREFNTEQVPQLLGNPEVLSKGIQLLEGLPSQVAKESDLLLSHSQ